MSQQQPKLMSPSRSEPLPANMSAMSSPGSKPSKASGTTAGRHVVIAKKKFVSHVMMPRRNTYVFSQGSFFEQDYHTNSNVP